MKRTNRIVWRAVGTGRELLTLEGGAITVAPYTLTRDEAVDLHAALADCLGLVDSIQPAQPSAPETPCSSAQPS